MNKTILRKTVARNASIALLTVALLLACVCSPLAEKDPSAGQREGWDLLPEILSRIVPPTFPDRDFNINGSWTKAGGGLKNSPTNLTGAHHFAISSF